MFHQMENNVGGRQHTKEYDASVYFLAPPFSRLASHSPPPTLPQMEDTPWPLPLLWLAVCQGQGVFQRQSLASPGQSLETSVGLSACLTSKVSQLQDATTSDFYEMCSALCIAFDLRRALHTLIRSPYHPWEAARHLRGTQGN